MAKISREILRRMIEEGFFNDLKSTKQIIDRLDQKGFSISGKKIGLVGQLLAKLCQEGILERKKDAPGNWQYKKVQNG